MPSMPVIAIVGRPNVGKSSLLNALTGKRISIVQDMPGVTRDRVSTPLPIGEPPHYVELIDTGGYGFIDDQGLTEHIKQQIEIAMTRANLVLFLVDTDVGLTAGDEEIALLLRRKNVKTVVIANKADSEKADTSLADFSRMGFGTPIGVSAMNGRNIGKIFDVIGANVDMSNAPSTFPTPQMQVAIVGKRNAGKSTLVNAIAEIYEDDPNRVIVSEVAGTTRDSVDVRFEKDGQTLVVIDTAGVRKKRHMVTNDIEFYSFHRAQRSIRRADVVMMLIDGTEHISEPDKKLAQYIAEQEKPVVLVVNKWDQVIAGAKAQAEGLKTEFSSELLMEEFSEYLDHELKHLDFAPVAFITAKDGKNVQVVLDMSQHLYNQANERVNTGRLNRAVRQILDERTPSTQSGRRVKVFYATQIATAPPTIVLVVNNPDLVDKNYQRFMMNRFRELLPYAEVPIKIMIRGRGAGAPAEPEGAEEVRREDNVKASARSAKRRETRSARRVSAGPGKRPGARQNNLPRKGASKRR